VVDDAIVVVENVERWLEQGLEPREAPARAMDEGDRAGRRRALVLCAVFVPCAFISGITGQSSASLRDHRRQSVISAFNSLTLSPPWRHPPQAEDRQRDRLPGCWTCCSLVLPALQLAFDKARPGTAGCGPTAARQPGRPAGLRRSAVLTLVAFRAAPRLRPSRRQGRCPDHPTARLGVAGAYQGGRGRIGAVARQIPGVAHTIGSRARRSCSSQQPTFATMFIVLEPFANGRPPT